MISLACNHGGKLESVKQRFAVCLSVSHLFPALMPRQTDAASVHCGRWPVRLLALPILERAIFLLSFVCLSAGYQKIMGGFS